MSQYDQFIQILKAYENAQMKVHAMPQSSYMESFPSLFLLLLPEAWRIIHQTLPHLYGSQEQIILFGFQQAPMGYFSDFPLKTGRIYQTHEPRQHLCYTLSYVTQERETIPLQTDWSKSKSLVIDFTTGAVMNANQYLSLLLEKELGGVIYGHLAFPLLQLAWESFLALPFKKGEKTCSC